MNIETKRVALRQGDLGLIVASCGALLLGAIFARSLVAADATPPVHRTSVVAPPELSRSDLARHQAHELSQPLEFDSLVLPLVTRSKLIPPYRASAQQVALERRSTRRAAPELLWKTYPWQAEHAEFVERWQGARDEASRLELLRWCEQQRLYDCSEFLLRLALYEYQYRATSENYRWYLNRWREQGAHQRRSPFTFGLPVRGQWQVMVDSDRHHQTRHWSVWAWDLIKPRGGELHDGSNNVQSYYTWRQPVYAVSEGTIVAAVDHFADQPAGVRAGVEQGNYVLLDCGGGVMAYYGHLRNGGVRVRAGDHVQAGEMLGLVGNSGDSGMPHLHFTLMDADGFSIRGRYQAEIWTTTGWVAYDGVDLSEGWYFREVQ